MSVTAQQIEQAAKKYCQAVTGPMGGCKHPAEVLRWVIEKCSNPSCVRLAENFVKTGRGACWNAMVGCMPANAWLVWYTGKWQEVSAD